MLVEYRNEKQKAKLVIEDDGKTAYAYLIIDEAIVGDVWLYNVGDSPREPEWPDPDRMPYANPVGFVWDEDFDPVRDASEVSLNWEFNSLGGQQVEVWLRGRLHAVLRSGAKPGWCRLAAKAGPVAKPIDEID